MNYRILILFAGTALAISACAKHDSDNTAADAGNASDVNMAVDNGSAANGAAAAPMPTTAQAFVDAAAASDRFEIESSKLAASASTSKEVKRFATQMISTHTASTAKLKSTLAGLNPPLTPDNTLSPDQQQKLDSLKGLKGAEFDRAYVAAQTQGHQMTLDVLNNYASSGDNPTLKTFANGLVPTVTAHLNMANGLDRAMTKDMKANDGDTNLSNGM